MSDKKTYKATSPIKRNGELYEIGDTLKLTEDEAEGLHVERKQQSAAGSQKSGDGSQKTEDEDPADTGDGMNSHTMGADEAISFIDEADEEDLEGFLDPEEEERVTVLRAWDERFDTNLAEDE